MNQSTVGNPDSSAWIEKWLSEPRLATYLSRCHGNRDEAMRLYEWNSDLGLVLLKDIGYFEIALRNAYDRVIGERWNGEDHWLFDSSSPVNVSIPRRTRAGVPFDANALNRSLIAEAGRGSRGRLGPDSTIANLSFGFWAHLTDKAHERALWIPYLHHAWPAGTNRATLDSAIRSIGICRNRIAHHEHLFDPKDDGLLPTRVDRSIVELFCQLVPENTLFSPGAPTPVDRFLKEHPMPGDLKSLNANAFEQTIAEYFAMWVRRDFSRFDKLFSLGCVYEECYGPVYVGTNELHRWIDHMLARQTVTAWNIHSVESDPDGETFFVSWTFSATEEESYIFDGISRIHFDSDGRIDHVKEYRADHDQRRPFESEGQHP
ncbi:nuclear transport factor 2 family protein [Olsenella sp. SW781]|uniref:nuclear transport factor 2 family protein n=1 Tax=Olsenella sp. SW781 TaxID=2530046 RepID=UPI001439A191|nr:nuclear transport factor 2 family protein [Olsenella sp. SW781]NJE80493.1 nuclear transport factor 2 family protein [Olsenella sp. SW781]